MGWAGRLERAARGASVVAVVSGLASVGLQLTGAIRPGPPQLAALVTAPSTAVAIALAGAALWLRLSRRRMARVAADVAAAAVALVIVAGMFSGRIGLLRPAYNTLVAALLVAGALLMMDRRRGRLPLFQWLTIGAGVVALLAMAGYVYGSPHLYGAIEQGWGMSAIAALGLLVVSAGVLWARPEQGLMRPLTLDDARGRTLRRLMPALAAIPLFAVGLRTLARGEAQVLPTVAALLAGAAMVGGTCLVIVFANVVAREALAEERLRRLFETTSDAVMDTSSDGTVLRWNPACEDIYGYAAADIVGRSIAIVVPPDEHAALWAMRAEVMASRRSHLFEGARVRKDGSIFYASTMVSPVIDAGGEVVGISAITHDLTARIEAEEAIRRAHASEQRLRGEIERNRNELLASENKFRTLAEALPQIVWITRPDGWNTYFNQQWVTYTGMTMEESYGHGWNIPFHPDDRQRAWDAWQRAVKTDGVYELECRLRRADGTYRWWLIRGVSLHDASGNVTNWFGTCTDVEDIKQTEERLIASEERFRLALDEAPIGMALASLDGRFLRVNRALCEIVGYSADELTRLSFQVITHPDDRDADGALATQLTSGEIPRYQLEKRYVRKDGALVDVLLSVSLLRGRDQSPQYFIKQIEEITDRKRAEAERERLLAMEREHGARLQAIRESSLAISELQLAGAIKVPDVLRSIVEQARQLTGAPYGAVGIGSEEPARFDSWIFSGIAKEEAELDAFVGVPISHGGRVVGNLYLAKRPGEASFHEEDRSVVELLASHAAIAIENARLYDELQAAVRAREELLAIVSHDLKNPLHAISIREQVLERQGDPGMVAHAQSVRRSIGSMQRMINGLLDAASLDAGQLRLEVGRHDLEALVSEAVDLISPIARSRHVAIVCRIPSSASVLCDRERLIQVLSNLIGNAVKFTQANGTITIMTERSHSELLVAVADTGAGITADALPHVFDRYFTQGGHHGTGLGLHIAKGLVEAHGGRIWATSEPGKGSTFFFTLPEARVAEAAQRPA